jgi:hypothetical protein
MKQIITPFFPKIYWRSLLMIMIVFGSLALMFLQPSIPQNQNYHNFADRKAFFEIPNFLDVMSNIAFLFTGIAGLGVCFRKNLGVMQTAWFVLFIGVALVSVGSAYYHWSPNNQTLVWDRLPMTLGFMGLFVVMLGEYINEQFSKFLIPAIVLGFSSVIYWHLFDDLRFYIWIQLISLLIIPVVLILYRPKYSHQWMMFIAVGLYALAKIAEVKDGEILLLSFGLISGHTIKHLVSAIGCGIIVWMLQKRELLE